MSKVLEFPDRSNGPVVVTITRPDPPAAMKLDRRQKRTTSITIRISSEMKRAACDRARERGRETTLSKYIVDLVYEDLQSQPGCTDVSQDRRRAA
jgi:hypothetical protein